MAYDLAPSPGMSASLPAMMAGMGQPPDPPKPLPERLRELMDSKNIAEDLPDSELGNISTRVLEEYDIDKNSRSEWEKRTEAALKLAMMVAEQKDYPFPNAANIKFPLLTTAALQFNARAYPAIVAGNRVVKCQTWGADQDGQKRARAERVGEHLSYQLLSELPEWEEDTDKLLVILPIIGCVFRKVFWDDSLKRTSTRLITADRLVVNYHARSLHDVPRLTEEMRLYPYEIQERIRSGRFIGFEYGEAAPKEGDEKKEQDGQNDPSAPHLFLEQHTLLDLDEDGYPEPYVVTVHHASQKVCRIVANYGEASVSLDKRGKVSAIRKTDYYVQYLFLPSPDGGFYGAGFGWYLKDIGEAINSTSNQLLDAGHLANIQGGFISANAVADKEKTVRLKMGEFRILRGAMPPKDAVSMVTFPGPNKQLFDLLGYLVETGKELASIKDVLTGDTPATAPVGTTLAIIEQGLQVFTAIYKRVHRALKAELGLHARIMREHPDDAKYAKFFDDGQQYSMEADYNQDDCDIVPVTDPSQVSRMQQVARAQVVREWSMEPPQNPTANPWAVAKRILDAAQIENPEELIQPPPQPDPAADAINKKLAQNVVRQQEADIIETETKALKNIADAEAKEAGSDLDAYAQQATVAGQDADRALAAAGQQADREGKDADRAMNAQNAEADRAMAAQGQQMDFANAGADRALQAEGMQMDNMNRAMDRDQAAEQADLDRQGRIAELESKSRNTMGAG